MRLIERIAAYSDQLTSIRRDFHKHPELGFEEKRTSDIIAELLQSWGITVHRGMGGTGVVGVIEGRRAGGRKIGLRADMDALPIPEETDLPYKSVHSGRSHACGHDGHMAMLLGAARYLAETRDFSGTAILVFQPAEEGLGGARAMIRDGLFQRFPCDEIYSLHNAPHLAHGQIALFPGPAMAGADFFDIKLVGVGSHAARPERAKDPVLAAMTLGQALQSIVSRNVDPKSAAVLSITQIHAGAAYNVIPSEATLSGTVRAFSDEVRRLVRERINEIAQGVASGFAVTSEVEIRDIFTVLENHAEQTTAYAEVARSVVGDENVVTTVNPVMSSEDFADMLRVVPGAYCWLGQGGNIPVHNPAYVFDDAALPVGASLLARLVETRGAA